DLVNVLESVCRYSTQFSDLILKMLAVAEGFALDFALVIVYGLHRIAQEYGDLVNVRNPQADQRENTEFGIEPVLLELVALLGPEQAVELVDKMGIHFEEGTIEICIQVLRIFLQRFAGG